MSFGKIVKDLKLENVFTKPPVKQKVFNHVKNSVPPIKGYNYQADLLHLPTTDKDNKFLLVVVDLADNSFDIEELQNRDALSVLNGFKNMFKRQFIKEPKISVRTDAGSEFQKEFNKYLDQKNIIHSVSLPNRHKQTANVESLNKELGRVFNSYMNKKEIDEDEQYNNWDDIIKYVRTEGNKIKKIKLPKYEEWKIKLFDPVKAGEPKFKIGDFVFRSLDSPKNALGKNQTTKKFRIGDFRWDTLARKIEKVIYMPDFPYYRYMLHGIKQASYSENELIKAEDITEQKYNVQKFVDFRTHNKIKQVKIKWEGLPASQNTWENVNEVIKDIGKKSFDDYTELYNDEYRKLDAKFMQMIKKAEEAKQVFKLDKELEEANKTGLRRSERIRNIIKM